MGGTPIEEKGYGDTDTTAVRDGYISVTPLQVDFTNHSALKMLGDNEA
jgi:5'-nucleotidase